MMHRRGTRPGSRSDLLGRQVGGLQRQVRYRVPAVWQQRRSSVQRLHATSARQQRTVWHVQSVNCMQSQWGGRDRVAVAHQHKIGHLVSYLEIQWPEHVPRPPPANITLETSSFSTKQTYNIYDLLSTMSPPPKKKSPFRLFD